MTDTERTIEILRSIALPYDRAALKDQEPSWSSTATWATRAAWLLCASFRTDHPVRKRLPSPDAMRARRVLARARSINFTKSLDKE